jgi:hypothetical protein
MHQLASWWLFFDGFKGLQSLLTPSLAFKHFHLLTALHTVHVFACMRVPKSKMD